LKRNRKYPMIRCPTIKRPSGRKLQTLTSALIWPLLVAGLGLAQPIPAATISIPGSVSVTIQPPEAVADGARWSVDGGTAQVSGASVTNLPAGPHAVQF